MLKQFINMSTTDIILHILAAVVPAMILMYYIYRKDRVEKEPAGLLLKLFIAGAVSTGAAIILEIAAEYLEVNVLTQVNAGAATFAIVDATMVGIIEEACKFFFLKRITWKNPNFNYTFDGIVYAACVGLGFAGTENILYLLQSDDWVGTGIVRGLTAVPAHFAIACAMGYFYSKRHFGDRSRITAVCILAVPILIHWIYDALAFSEIVAGPAVSVVVNVLFVLLIWRVYKSTMRRINDLRQHDQARMTPPPLPGNHPSSTPPPLP